MLDFIPLRLSDAEIASIEAMSISRAEVLQAIGLPFARTERTHMPKKRQKTRTLYMETTEINPGTTAAEIESVLARAGATAVSKTYADGELHAMRFMLPVAGVETPFWMPARVDSIEKLLLDRPRRRAMTASDRERIRAQAKRCAWRILLRWVEAQVAIIETGMVETGEAFMSYAALQGADGEPETLWTRYQRLGMRKALPMLEEDGR